MKYLVTGTEMKYLDENTSKYFHVPQVVLMEQAALGFVREFLALNPSNVPWKKGIVFCGSGNNGGDGIAIARLLNEQGIYTEICHVSKCYRISARDSELCSIQKEIYDAYAFPIADSKEMIVTSSYDFVIDAVFGTGLSRVLSVEYQQVIADINHLSAKTFAVDIPSGICADNGKCLGGAVVCDYTITFSFEKIGHFLWPGNEYTGQLICTPIGITERSWLHQKPYVATLELSDLYQLPKRQAHSNKGTYGKLLLIAGTKNMAGAAILSAKAAYRSGAGLVKIYTSEQNRIILQTAVPEAILATYYEKTEAVKQSEEKKEVSYLYGVPDVNMYENLQEHLAWADAVVLGPGIGTLPYAEILVDEVIQNVHVPLLLDADALNILARSKTLGIHENIESTELDDLCYDSKSENAKSKQIEKKFIFPMETVLTPHLGEMARLLQKPISEIQENILETAVTFAKQHHVTCVLKDFRTIIAHDTSLPIYLNLSGNNGMATAGSGDVLTGIIGTFLAQGMQKELAAAYGVFLHGLAGNVAMKTTGMHGMCAQDIIEGLKEVWNKVEHDGNQ